MDLKRITPWWLFVFIALAVVAVGVPVVIGGLLGLMPDALRIPEVVLPVVLLSGLVALVAVLTIMTTVVTSLGLADPTRAFALPEGTVRGVIALSLLLIFAIVSVFLYRQLRVPQSYRAEGLGQDQFSAIPGDQIVSSTKKTDPQGVVSFDVDRVVPNNPASEDFAKQMLTTIGTLVVAVAGFYFGTSAVAAAQRAVASAPPVIRSVNPANGKQGETLERVEILGSKFASPATVSLKRGSKTMALEGILSSDTKIVGKLSIPAKQDAGLYELTVVNADGGADHLPDAFEVKEGGSPEPTEEGHAAVVAPPPQAGQEVIETPPPQAGEQPGQAELGTEEPKNE